jgi:glycine/D-amino acid oxidase-like deaminating enzyme
MEHAEVVVIGGGVIGTSIAFHLAEAGVDVLLLERGELGCSELHAAFPLSAPCMSHHTRILQECGLIGLRKDGAYHFFHARTETIRLYSPNLLNPALASDRR